MERPLFDPARIRGPAEPGPTGPTLLSPRQVNELISGAISRHLPATVYVLGEIADFSRHSSGHLYFTLKGQGGQVRAVMWRSSVVRLRFEPREGMELIATGALEVYAPRGTYQLIVRALEPRGQGAHEIAFRQLQEKLRAEGLLSPGRKRPLPKWPGRVAVITSASGAAIRDIAQAISRRYAALEILLFPAAVQGDGAAGEIAAAIRNMNEVSAGLGGIDVAIIGRGGGSLEDLSAFNQEIVARAIADSAIPIISAVGHEIDVTISDLVADVRAATPTAAAELVTPDRRELSEALRHHLVRIERRAREIVRSAQAEVRLAQGRDFLRKPDGMISERFQRLDESSQALVAATRNWLMSQRERLRALELGALRFGSRLTVENGCRRIDGLLARSRIALDRSARLNERRIHAAALRIQGAAPAARTRAARDQAARALTRLTLAITALLKQRGERLRDQAGAAALCDPQRVLARGYSITRRGSDGQIIRHVQQVQPGARLVTQVADGEFLSVADAPGQQTLF